MGKALLELNLSQNFLDEISFLDNSKNSLSSLSQLRSLNLANNQIKFVKWNAQYSLKNTSLKTLDISYNQLADLSFLQIFEGLTSLKIQANPVEMSKQTV